MSAMVIRPARVADAASIARLATELGYPTSHEQATSRLEVLTRSDSHFIVVAERSSRVVGWVAAERRVLLESGERAEIVGLVVEPESRRSGVGAALVRAAETWAIARGLSAIGVRSNVVRTSAHPFYEKLGYVRTKTQHAYSKDLTAV